MNNLNDALPCLSFGAVTATTSLMINEIEEGMIDKHWPDMVQGGIDFPTKRGCSHMHYIYYVQRRDGFA